ncbi:hypothetical protein CC78DRAFT_459497 [Lojkania enalia]|uniref:Glycosyltransferase family 20 protein n=1 Tax=Lojkania enalia TaxID=147567 RepID=A0A9P4KH48_9PLEO|nr:hypothetical protein CC78DRAFT_459497 [Didymosphaeria enalia]
MPRSFLPSTIDFHDPDPEPVTPRAPTGVLSQVPPLTLGDIGRQNSALTKSNVEITGIQQPASLFKGVETPPQTPAVIEKKDDFFIQAPLSAAAHFPNPLDPKTLVRSDSHVAEWGASFFNQPRSTAGPAPPETILQYAKGRERTESSLSSSRRSSPSKKPGNGRRDEGRWATSWSVVPAVQGNGGLTNAIRAAVRAGSMGDVLSVGTIGFPTDTLDETKKIEIYERLEADHESLTVYVSDKDFDGHYNHFSKTILWPVFHYQIPDHPKSKAYLDHSWIFYEKVNQAFADKVIANYKRGDIIWVHDYHLCLVPGMIRKKLPEAQIGFFLHSAFPSSEVFRCLAERRKLLEGMLGANLVAFQTPEYAHHFLQTCSRILSVEATEDGIQLDAHFVNVWSLPIGIDPKTLGLAREEPDVLKWVKEIKDRYPDKRLIVARDKLDSIGGVRQKLLAFELFLNQYPEWKDKVVLIQVATSTTENEDLAATISEIVTRIDAVHSTLAHNPLVLLRQDIPFSQLLALLSVADALMITSLREGMNLTCHEFVICQDGRACPDKKHGPVILSEFTGSSAVFGGAELAVNPWDYKGCAEAMRVALEMSEEEKDRRYVKMRDIVMVQTGESWMRQLTEHLAKVHEEHGRRDTMSIPRLSVAKLSQAYEKANKRLFILDYEGTLASWGNVSSTVLMSPQRVTDILNDLISDPKNLLYIMSGRTIEEVEMIFGRVPSIGLIAENGCYVRECFSDEWTAFADEARTKKWMDAVKDIMRYYLERVENSWIEERHCSLIFHYEKSDEFDSAARHAGDCANHVNEACASQRVRAYPAKDCVIIEPIDYDKGTAAKHIWSKFAENERPDFLMVAGNDRDDELVFRWAKNILENNECPNITSVSVGNRNTVAMSTLTNGTTGRFAPVPYLLKTH